MRMHTCLHLLCALVKFPVTGGQVGSRGGPARFRHRGRLRRRQGRAHRAAQRADRRRSSGERALDQRRGAGGQSGAGAHHVGEAADGHRAGCAWSSSARTARSTCSRAAARTSSAPARSDASPSRKHREEGQAEPAHPRRVRLNGGNHEHAEPCIQMAGRDRLAGRAARRARPRRARRLAAPADHRPQRQGRVPGSAHPGRALLRHRRHLGREQPAAAHAALAREVRQPHEEDGARRRHARGRLRHRGALLGGARLVDVPHHGPRRRGGAERRPEEMEGGRARRWRTASRHGAPSATSRRASMPSWCATPPR